MSCKLLLAGDRQSVNMFCCFTPTEVGNPARLKSLPHIKVAVHNKHCRVTPGPLANKRFVKPSAHHKKGNKKFQATNYSYL